MIRLCSAWLGGLTLCLGALTVVRPLHAQFTPAPRRVLARVTGSVYDSLSSRPLDGALVQLVSAADPSRIRAATADADGAYLIDSVQAGTYLLGILHPRVDSLGMEVPMLRVDVRADGIVRANLGLPSAQTLVARRCGIAAGGLFMGTVRRATGDTLPGPARVRAQWPEVSVGPNGMERRTPSRFTSSTASGQFALCGVPAGGKVNARAYVAGDSSGVVELEVPRSGLLMRDLLIGSSTRAGLLLQGPGAVRGVVKSATGQPVRNARIVLWGSGHEDTTGTSGQFTMKAVPTGTYALEARAMGYAPRRVAVDIPAGTDGVVELSLDVAVPSMDTVRVRATRNPSDQAMLEFEKRRKMGGGYFIDEAQLAKRQPMFMSDMLRGTPGITITPASDTFGDQIYMRGTSGAGSCVPAIYIDGVRAMNTDATLDNIVNPQQVRAVEIYSRSSGTPNQFQSQNGCGTVVIWTGPRKPATP